MKNMLRTLVSVAVLSLMPLSMVVASSAQPEYTVGEFAVNLARMVTHKANYTPEPSLLGSEPRTTQIIIAQFMSDSDLPKSSLS